MTAVTKPEAPRAAVSVPIEGGSVTDLLRIAVERGTPVAELKELVALHDQMAQRQARQEFAAAMAAFQQECPPIKHERTASIVTSKGSSYKYTYAELDVIAKKVNPILARHGLSYRWNTKVEGNTLTCECVVSHTAGHSESSFFALPVENPSAMSPQQKVGAAYTFAQRRSLSAALGITTTDDDTDAGDVDPKPVSEEQLHTIEDLCAERDMTGRRLEKFLAHMGVANLDEIRAVDYQKAVNTLKQVAPK